MGVHADLVGAELGDDARDDGFEIIHEGAAVGVAEGEVARSTLDCGGEGLEGVVGVGLVAVEKVLGVVNHLAALGGDVADGVLDHGEVFLERGAQDLGDVEGPGLAHEGEHGRLGLEQGLELRVLGGGDAGAAGGAEGGEFGVLELQLFGLGEEGDVAGVGAGEAALDVVHPEGVELLRDEQFVGHGEADALPLGAIAEGGVVDFNGVAHGKVGGGGKGGER